jgi:hypothetical protein
MSESPRTSVQWGVAHGSPDPARAEVYQYDDEEDAAGHLDLCDDGYLVSREVREGPWRRATTGSEEERRDG